MNKPIVKSLHMYRRSALAIALSAAVILAATGLSGAGLTVSADTGPTATANDFETVEDVNKIDLDHMSPTVGLEDRGATKELVSDVCNTGSHCAKVAYHDAAYGSIHFLDEYIPGGYTRVSFWIRSEKDARFDIVFYDRRATGGDTGNGVYHTETISLPAGQGREIALDYPDGCLDSNEKIRVSVSILDGGPTHNTLWFDTVQFRSAAGTSVRYGATATKEDVSIDYTYAQAGNWIGLFAGDANELLDTPVAHKIIETSGSGSFTLAEMKADLADGHYKAAFFKSHFDEAQRDCANLDDVYTAEGPRVFLNRTVVNRRRINPEKLGTALKGDGYETDELVITYVNANMATGRKDRIYLYYHREDAQGNTMYHPAWDNASAASGILAAGEEQKAIGEYRPKLTNLVSSQEYVIYFWDTVAYTYHDKSQTFKIEPATASAEKPDAPSGLQYAISADKPGMAGGTLTFNRAEDESKLDGYALYWGDDNGKLAGYTAIAELPRTGKNFSYTLHDNMLIPKEATRLLVCAKNKSQESDFSAAAVPAEKRDLSDEEELYSFQVMSDVHVQLTNDRFQSENFDRALQTIKQVDPDSKAIVVNGDFTENGRQNEYDNYKGLLEKNKEGLPPVYESLGNHELCDGTAQFNLNTLLERFKANTGKDNVYYHKRIGDADFIALGTDTPESGETAPLAKALLSDAQLSWLDETLRDNRREGIPTFIALHQPVGNTTGGSIGSGDLPKQAQLIAVLEKYENVFLITGHTHMSISASNPLYVNKSTAGKHNIYMFNDGSLSDQSTDEGPGVLGSEGLFVEVYRDRVLVRGYDYDKELWAASAQFRVDLTGVAEDNEPDYELVIPAGTHIPMNAEKTALNGELYASRLKAGGRLQVTVTAGKLFNQTYPNEAEKALPYALQSGGAAFNGVEYTAANVKNKLDVLIRSADWNKALPGKYQGTLTFHAAYQANQNR